jgi:hypothetical protein
MPYVFIISNFSSTSISCRNWSPNYSVLVIITTTYYSTYVARKQVSQTQWKFVHWVNSRRENECDPLLAFVETHNHLLQQVARKQVSQPQWKFVHWVKVRRENECDPMLAFVETHNHLLQHVARKQVSQQQWKFVHWKSKENKLYW